VNEFTGERVIPGEVNDDLWAEHVARYAFAKRFARRKRVLDLGCGTGYGTADLAERARLAIGIDISGKAIEYASAHFPKAQFLESSATTLPFAPNSFDVVTAFEVIEHLADWSSLLAEARRVLRPKGVLIVSTPNKLYYAEARGKSGPNPFHEHEFEFAEFQAALAQYFPHVAIFLQDRLEAFAFHPVEAAHLADGHLGRHTDDPTKANFFVGICSCSPMTDAHPFVYVPKTSNLLGEREKHIGLLEEELSKVKRWLQETLADRDELIAKHKELEAHLEERSVWALQNHKELEDQLEERNRWALHLEAQLTAAQERIVQLQDAFESEQERATEALASLSEENIRGQERAMAAIASLTEENLRKTSWAQGLEQERANAVDQLGVRGKQVENLEAELAESARRQERAEATIEERTQWAQRLQEELAESDRRLKQAEAATSERSELATRMNGELQQIIAQLEMIRHSRWIRLGRLIGLGPDLRKHGGDP